MRDEGIRGGKMKRLFTVLILIILLIIFTLAAQGEVITDTWYDIEKTTPYIEGYTTQSDDYQAYQLEYLQNDQTYVHLRYSKTEYPSTKILDFSYLFDCGFFIASGNLETDGFHFNALTPGYKFKLSNDDYLAISLTYISYDRTFDDKVNEIDNYRIKYVSYPENMKIDSNLFIPTEGSIFGNFSLKYQVAEQLVVGGSIFKTYSMLVQILPDLKVTSSTSKCSFSVGSTWTPAQFIIDNTFEEYDGEFNYSVSGMYKFNSQFRAGLGYSDQTEQFCVKANLSQDNSSLKFFYYPKNEDNYMVATFELAYLKYL